jgi:hypothetical protein
MFIPLAASAQLMPLQDELPWGARLRVTPYVGLAPAVTRIENYFVEVGGTLTQGRYDVDFASGQAVGADIEVRVYDRFSLLAGGTYIRRGETIEFSEAAGSFTQREGSDFLMAKAGLAVRLTESVSEMQLRHLSASVYVAPTYVREMPRPDVRQDPLLLEDMATWGVSLGLDAEIPLGSERLAAQVGIEDVVTFWNEGELASRNDALFAQGGLDSNTTVKADLTHQWLIRAGLTFRLN